MMNCEQVQGRLLEVIRSDAPDELPSELRDHISTCDVCKELVADATIIRDQLRVDSPLVPSGRMRERFYAGIERQNSDHVARRLRIPALARMAAAVVVIFSIGYASASLLQRDLPRTNNRAASISGETSAERLAAIYASIDAAAGESDLVDALLHALRSDPSPNVRLAAVEALAPAVADTRVATTIQQSVLLDDSPSVQAAALRVLAEGSPTLIRSTVTEYLARRDVEQMLRDRAEELIRTEI